MSQRDDAALLWAKALEDRRAAHALRGIAFSGVANRAYYAVFHAVSALFYFEGNEDLYKKHSAVESAVHRDLVRTGRWTRDVGAAYTSLHELRLSGDYGIAFGVSEEESQTALDSMEIILAAISEMHPDFFILTP